MTTALVKLQQKYGASERVRDADEKHQAPDDRHAAGYREEGAAMPEGCAGGQDTALSWRDSEAILALRSFLKLTPELRARIGLVAGCVALHFDPPLDPKDTVRWRAACEAETLLRLAREDIRLLALDGALTLQVIDHRVIDFGDDNETQ